MSNYKLPVLVAYRFGIDITLSLCAVHPLCAAKLSEPSPDRDRLLPRKPYVSQKRIALTGALKANLPRHNRENIPRRFIQNLLNHRHPVIRYSYPNHIRVPNLSPIVRRDSMITPWRR